MILRTDFFLGTMLVLLTLSGCQTTQTNLILGPTLLQEESSIAKDLLFWYFGDPKEGYWDRFNTTYESRYLGGINNEPIERMKAQTETSGISNSDSNRTPPGYSDLLKEPSYASEYAWKSSEHAILIDSNSRRKLKSILDILELEISVLEDNIVNLNKTMGTAPFLPSRPIFGNGLVIRIEHVSSTPTIEAMVRSLKQDVLDYNSILGALDQAGYLYLGLERVAVPMAIGSR